MKQLKRILSIVIVLAVMASCLVFANVTSFAANATLSPTSATVYNDCSARSKATFTPGSANVGINQNTKYTKVRLTSGDTTEYDGAHTYDCLGWSTGTYTVQAAAGGEEWYSTPWGWLPAGSWSNNWSVSGTLTVKSGGHTWNSGTITTNPTCTANGVKTYTCTGCSQTKTEAITKLGHDYSSKTTTSTYLKSAATCTAKAVYYYKCSRCDAKGSSTYESGSALGHSWDAGVITTQPSCTATGVKTYTCTRDSSHTYTESVAALGHNYNSVVTAPTCTTAGYTTHTCSRCGNSYTDSATNALGHNYTSEVTTAPGCTTIGVRTYTCSRCGDSYTEEIAATGHTVVTDAAVAPTCTETGLTQGSHCSVCNAVIVAQETVAALGHNYVATVTAPTCTENGYTTHICSRCNDTYTDTVVAALGHDYVETITAPTCTEGGYTTYACSRCDMAYTDDETEPLGHNYVGVVTAPTCTESGYTTYTCSRCGDSYVADATEATGHTWNEGVVTTDPTCTETGVKTYTCTVCNVTRTETVEALGHDYAATVTDPTCTEAGYTTHECSRCHDSYTDTPVPALGHVEAEWAVATAATCTEAGLKTKTCSRCSEVYASEVIPATGHTPVTDAAVAPTCTETGLTEGSHCSVCNTVLVAQETVPATGHTPVTDAAVAPTCTETGLTEGSHCSVCNTVLVAQETVPATGHTPVTDAAVAPTCTETGLTEGSHCSVCNTILVAQETVPATGHAYGEWTVTTPATCTATGVETRVCANDANHTETRDIAIDPNNHDFVFTRTVASTCTEAGYDIYTCSRCEATEHRNEVEATGHAYGEWTVTTPATCTATGVETRVCANDANHTETRDIAIDPNNHDFQFTETVAPTCTEAGYDIYTCSRCEATEHRNEVEATGHTWDEGTITTAPTCTQTGVKTFNCINCDATRTETVAVIDHTAGTRTVETVDGVEKYVTRCTECGTIISVEEIEGADYTALNEAIAKANALNTVEYYDVSAVTSAVNAVVTGLNAEHQAEVDAMTASINDAIAGLKKIVSLMTVNRATVKQNGETITIMMSEGAASSALSSVLKNNDSVTISNIENLTVSKDGRYVAKSNAFATMTLKDGRQYNLVFKPYALDISADGIRTIMVDRTSIVVDNDARTITMNSESNKPYVVIYNTISGSPITIENADLYTEYRYKIERPASMKFESTLTIKGIEYALRVNFMPYFEAEADGFTTMFVKEDTIQIDNAARTITMHTNNNATYAVIYNYYGGYKSGKSVTIDDAELYSTYRWKIEKPEGGVFNSTIYVDGVPFDLTVYFDEVLTKKEVKYEISGTDIIIRSITTDKTEITVPATMTIGETTYNVVIGKTVLEQAEDGYMDPVSGVFYNNRNITKVTFEDGVRVEDNDAEYMFSNSSVQEVYNLPDSITDMYACFYNCTALTTVDAIPESVTELGYAFNRCRALTGDLTINAENVTNIDRNVFRYAGQNGGLTIYATGDTYTAILEKGSLGANVKLEQF